MRAFPWSRRPIAPSGLLSGGRTGTRRRFRVVRLLGAGASCLFALGSACPTDLQNRFVVEVHATGTGSGTVAGHRITCEVNAGSPLGDCGESYINVPGSGFYYTATPASGSIFVDWVSPGAGSNPCADPTANMCNLVWPVGGPDTVMLQPHFATIGAEERALRVTTVIFTRGRSLIVSDDGQIRCRSNPDARDLCIAWYALGKSVTLTYVPTDQDDMMQGGLYGWGGCESPDPATVEENSCLAWLSEDRHVWAYFSVSQAIWVEGAGNGAGTVSTVLVDANAPDRPPAIDCDILNGATFGDCIAPTTIAPVFLVATPSEGSTWGGWGENSLNCHGREPCLIGHGNTARLTVVFDRITSVPLTVVLAGPGEGGVTSTPAGIDCSTIASAPSTDCSASYPPNTVVTLDATPGSNATFAGWSGGGCSGTSTCVVTLAAATTVTATFDLVASYDVAISITGTGEGTVTSSPTGIDCANFSGGGSTACTVGFLSGTVVTLSATPNGSALFTGWSGGGCSGTGTCVVTVTATTAVTATFDLPSYALTVAGAGTGAGTVTETTAGIACSIAAGVTSGTCTGSIPAGVVGQPVAISAQGSVFGGWTGDCAGAGACYLTMDQARSVTATFTTVPTFTLTIRQGLTVTGNGAVSSSPTGVACIFTSGQTEPTGTCVVAFPVGTVVTLTAGVAPPSTFTSWSGVAGCSSSPVCQVTMDQDQTVDVVISP